MTYEQYWLGEPGLVRFYKEAHEIKNRMDNQKLWLQGRYVYDAICAVSPILHAFAKQGTKPMPYNENVYPLTKDEAEQIRIEKEQRELEMMKARLTAWSAAMNAKLKKGG